MNFIKLAKGLFILILMVGSLATFSYSANASNIVGTINTTNYLYCMITPSRVRFMGLFEEFCNSLLGNEKHMTQNTFSSLIVDIAIMDQRVNEAILSISDSEQLKEYIKITMWPLVCKLSNQHTIILYKKLINMLDYID